MSLLLALLQALVLFAVAPLFSGVSRVARARMHNRRGPSVLQEYRDLFKLFTRQSVAPDAAGWVFRLTPFVMVGVMLTIATALPVVTVGSPLPVLGDLITLIYLFAIARFFFAIAGLDTGSPFTGIGASREAMLGVLVEPILLLGLWVAAQVAGSTHISFITDTVYHWPVARSIPLVLALCACAFATFIEMGKLPFDLAEAEQELQEGPLTEYSGYGFAVLKWGISLKQLVVLQMFAGVFFPWGQMTHFSVGGLVLAAIVAALKLLVGVLVIALFENSMRTFCCLPVLSPALCARLRCARGSPRPIQKSVSLMEPAVTAVAFSTTSTACGVAPTKSCRWMSISRVARQRLPRRCTVLQWRWACWSRKSTPVNRASSTTSLPRFCTRIWCSRCA